MTSAEAESLWLPFSARPVAVVLFVVFTIVGTIVAIGAMIVAS